MLQRFCPLVGQQECKIPTNCHRTRASAQHLRSRLHLHFVTASSVVVFLFLHRSYGFFVPSSSSSQSFPWYLTTLELTVRRIITSPAGSMSRLCPVYADMHHRTNHRSDETHLCVRGRRETRKNASLPVVCVCVAGKPKWRLTVVSVSSGVVLLFLLCARSTLACVPRL